jgi:predicted peroxiredoxin
VARILLKSAWGSEDPTRASFPFLHGAAFADLGHEVRIFLLGEAVNLMRDEVVDAIVPVGWPPLREAHDRVTAHGIPIHI